MGDNQQQGEENSSETDSYHTTTWQEFRDYVDKVLADEGISPDTPIWYIDISFPSNDFGVGNDKILGLYIS